jgi:hypothetical protein
MVSTRPPLRLTPRANPHRGALHPAHTLWPVRWQNRFLKTTLHRNTRYAGVAVAPAPSNKAGPAEPEQEHLPLNLESVLDRWSAIEDVWRRCAALGAVHRTRGDVLQFTLTIAVDALCDSALAQWTELEPVLLHPATYTAWACSGRFDLVQYIEQLKPIPGDANRPPPISYRITLTPVSRLRQWPGGEALVASIRAWAEFS